MSFKTTNVPYNATHPGYDGQFSGVQNQSTAINDPNLRTGTGPPKPPSAGNQVISKYFCTSNLTISERIYQFFVCFAMT